MIARLEIKWDFKFMGDCIACEVTVLLFYLRQWSLSEDNKNLEDLYTCMDKIQDQKDHC